MEFQPLTLFGVNKMKKFRIEASYTTYLYLEVEAEDYAQARDKANEADGGDFKDSGFSDWQIDSVEEL